jgi:hypothetical protein
MGSGSVTPTPLATCAVLRHASMQVVSRCVTMAGVLGASLAIVLTLGRGSIPGMFSRDPHVLDLVTALLPFVIISQPVNAMAFVWDGVLFGAGGFRWVPGCVRAFHIWTRACRCEQGKRQGQAQQKGGLAQRAQRSRPGGMVPEGW